MDIKRIADVITEDPNVIVDIPIAQKVVVTVPHAAPSAGDDNCTIVVAKMLGKELAKSGLKHDILYGDTARTKKDLNRPGARDLPWRRKVRKCLKPGAILLDVHSYDGNKAGGRNESWKYADCVIFNHPKMHNELFVKQFIDELQNEQIIAITGLPHRPNDIVRDANLAKAFGFLIEFNDQSLEKAPKIVKCLVRVIKKLQKLND